MEAATLQKKKINKTKLKKTIKNVICRPDPIIWPETSEEEKKYLENILKKYKVDIPEFKKLPWKELKSLPKEQRPKPPKIETVPGLIFGMTECLTALKSKDASSIILESSVNPRTVVQPVLEACLSNEVPVVCLDGLRKSCASYFGIPTSCLGVKWEHLSEISKQVNLLAQTKIPEARKIQTEDNDTPVLSKSIKTESPMDVCEAVPLQYLYRNSKTARVFIPPSCESKKVVPKFEGQDRITFSKQTNENNKKAYKKMLVKKISSNPNRVKVK